MSTPVIKKRLAGASPRSLARITGLFYLITILTGIYAQGFVSGTLVVDGDAAGTATNILAHKGLYQLGFAVYLIEMTGQIVMTALFYELLKPAGRIVSLVAAFLSLAGCVIKTFSRVFFFAPLFILGGSHYLNAFSASFLYPPLGYRVFPIIALLGLLGSAAKILWLLVKGVNEERWKEQAARA